MIDDHNECEWMNVSSGTGSAGLSRTKSRAVKWLCVCVSQKFVNDNSKTKAYLDTAHFFQQQRMELTLA